MQLSINKIKRSFFNHNPSFPIYSINENEIRTMDGLTSYCFDYEATDLEQLHPARFKVFYESIIESLNNLKVNQWVKCYRWNSEKVLINTNNPQLILGPMPPTRLMGPLSQFFNVELPFSDIDFFESYLTLNNEYWRLIHVESPPTDSFASFLDNFDCDYVLSFKKIDSNFAKKELNHKRRSQGVTLNTTHQNHEGEAAYDEANRLLKDITTDSESLFKTGLIFVVKETTHEDLNLKTTSLINSLNSKGARSFVETSGLDYYFTKILFGIKPCFFKGFKSDSRYLVNLLPNHKDELHIDGLGIYARNDNELLLDIFYEHSLNQNWLITGSSGQGKSFLTAALTWGYARASGIKIGIFDLGGSLQRVAKYFGAKDLTRSFNPLQFKCPHYLKNLILSVIGEKELTRIQKGMLFKYLESSIEDDIKDFKTLIINLNSVIPGIEYYFSELWNFFDESITELPNIFYLDIENKPEALIAPYLVFAKKLIEENDSWTLSIFDECWHIFNKCPDILREKAKTSRKKKDANIFITQEIAELSENYKELSKAIIANTYGKIYFNQPDLTHSTLSDFDRSKISQVNSKKGEYSEFYFQSVHHKKIARFYASPLIYELCNSERDEVNCQNEFIESLEGVLDYKDAMNRYIELKYGREYVH